MSSMCLFHLADLGEANSASSSRSFGVGIIRCVEQVFKDFPPFDDYLGPDGYARMDGDRIADSDSRANNSVVFEDTLCSYCSAIINDRTRDRRVGAYLNVVVDDS